MNENVPVGIITGYLGAGKTTLLKNIIKSIPGKLAILINEFGEIGIDSTLVKGDNVDMKELLNGCVCCSLTGEFQAAIDEIMEKVKPEMIIVETTGVAEPDAMITNMDDIKGVYLDSVVTVVDADAFLKFPNLGHTGRVQIESADVLILNKVDLVKSEDMENIRESLLALNSRASVIETTYSNVDTKKIFWLDIERPPMKKHGLHEPFFVDSFVYKSDNMMNKSNFMKFVSELPKEIYRMKGYVKFDNGSYFINYVNGRHDISKSNDETCKIVFIGNGISKFEKNVLKDLNNCELI